MKNLEFEHTIFDRRQVSSAQLRLPENGFLKNHTSQYSIDSALSKQKTQARDEAVKNLSAALQMDVSKLDQTDHNLINFLIISGRTQTAREFAGNPDVFRKKHTGIFKITGQIVELVNQHTFCSPRELDMEERLVDKLNKLIQDTFK